MSLPKRLCVIKDNVLPKLSLADVGSDHALLPAELLKEGKISAAEITDINEGPLLRAKQAVKAYSNVKIKQGNGLEPVESSEQAVIAGMGGLTILGILERDLKKAKNFKQMILQPMDHPGELRNFLARNFSVTKEITVFDRGKFYPVLVVQPGSTEYSDELELEYGFKDVMVNDSDRLDFLEYEKNILLNRIGKMKESDNPRTLERRREFLRRLNYIEGEIESFKNYSEN